VRGVLLPDF